MSLIAALSIGRSALQAQQRGLEVVGHNIANVNTEGYTRQRLDLISARPITLSGGIILGAGVDVRIIRATLDHYLDERIRLADSTLEDLRARRETLARIEAIVGELSETDLSSAFNRFFNAVEDLTNNPEDLSTRVTLVQVAEGLISEVQTVYSQLQRFREERVSAVEVAVGEINRLVENISELNTSIAARESEPSPQLANDLRDQRSALLTELSRLVYVRSYEDEQGMLNVYSGSYALVQGETYNTFEYSTEVVDGVVYPVITSERDGRELEVTGGRLLGFTEGGEAVIGELVSDLEKLISVFIYEVNRVHSQGQGLLEYSQVSSTQGVRDGTALLNDAGLGFAVENGSFNFNVVNRQTGQVKSFNIDVDLDGVGADSSLQSLVAEFAGEVTAEFSDITASMTGTGRLVIQSGSNDYMFTFGEDTSGFLAAIGLNTFFTGRGAADMGLNEAIASEPRFLAAARSGAPGDNSNALALATLRLAAIEELNGTTFQDFYQGIVSKMAAKGAHAQDMEENQAGLLTSLRNERERISGVSLDEEAIQLMAYQRAYQAAARYISIADEMMDTLMSL